jgi:hypothetical protein
MGPHDIFRANRIQPRYYRPGSDPVEPHVISTFIPHKKTLFHPRINANKSKQFLAKSMLEIVTHIVNLIISKSTPSYLICRIL